MIDCEASRLDTELSGCMVAVAVMKKDFKLVPENYWLLEPESFTTRNLLPRCRCQFSILHRQALTLNENKKQHCFNQNKFSKLPISYCWHHFCEISPPLQTLCNGSPSSVQSCLSSATLTSERRLTNKTIPFASILDLCLKIAIFTGWGGRQHTANTHVKRSHALLAQNPRKARLTWRISKVNSPAGDGETNGIARDSPLLASNYYPDKARVQ